LARTTKLFLEVSRITASVCRQNVALGETVMVKSRVTTCRFFWRSVLPSCSIAAIDWVRSPHDDQIQAIGAECAMREKGKTPIPIASKESLLSALRTVVLGEHGAIKIAPKPRDVKQQPQSLASTVPLQSSNRCLVFRFVHHSRYEFQMLLGNIGS
jgi:hypothetical protein